MLPGWLESVTDPVLRATEAPSLAALDGELLRQWGSSQVWRLSYGDHSVIAKRGTDGEADEALAYERFVVPLGLPAPSLIHKLRDADSGLLVLADVGHVNLEQEPSAEGFLAGAELVATIRSRSAGPSEFAPDRVKEMADAVGRRLTFDLEPLVDALAGLDRQVPGAVVHGDFVPKNLVSNGTRWTAVDWGAAYRAPHLSDLYTLVRDAVALGYDRAPIVAAYIDASGADPVVVDRQLTVGGACFCLRALAFVIAEGLRTIPDSENWVDPLLAELDGLVGDLA